MVWRVWTNTGNGIPLDVYVEVNQNGAHYWIHVVSDNVDAINQLDLMGLLKTKGFIE